MEIKWTSKALSDLNRLYDFLAPADATAAAKIIRSLTSAPNILSDQPRLGERLDAFEPREVRRLLVGSYEMRYEIQEYTMYVLRIWHTREKR
ncbi:plasmid stabilization protein [Salinivibrio sp. ML323]|uniref:type II toxin-antitoxin system RelE/ParE family toxin n=1 Tax=unclassified Salinivibrio TaxID=2636825 RepID=UPI000984A39C|nr:MULTISPECIES: type II toxin-antitoxin system RelE/ParE family toxin [unclassified Salinivibrio]OOE57544.1 plasmid stabilization protein [Salinivibrio sp. ML323]OOE63809.1 plasmid stabilization protein [Salinivibrio sp. IB282]